MEYDINEHRHRFSAWAAARATQRAFTSIDMLCDALTECGVAEFVRSSGAEPIDEERFRELHPIWCYRVLDYFTRKGEPLKSRASFGRAAKLIAVYLKSMVVLGPAGDSDLARIAHPPVDSILLRKASKAADIKSVHKRDWHKIKWTQLSEKEYDSLIGQLRSAVDSGRPFWSLERFWNPSRR